MPGPHGGVLKTVGTCAYCETSTDDACRICGRAVCTDHAVEGEPVCLQCGDELDED